jgi:type I restriction enzyme S subunit
MAESDPQKEIEEPYELPEGWVWTNLSDLSYLITKGATPTSYGFNYVSKGINFIKVENITKNNISSNSLHHITIEAHEFLKRSQLQEKDVLFSIAGTIGRSAIVKKHHLPANTNQALAIIRLPYTFISIDYIQLSLTNHITILNAQNEMRGVGMNNISLGDVNNIVLPLPPLPEQHRIVAKLEALLAQVNRSKDHLAKVPLLIKRFRQSVLAAACSGRLTEDWRREHPDVEPASELLNRIREERIRRYEEECQKAEVEGRKKPKKPKNIEPQVVDTEGLPELPEGWVWTKLGDVNETTSGGTPKRSNKDYYGGDIPWLKSGELEDNVITKAEETITELGLKKSSAKIFPTGTLLIALYGATVGKTGKLAIESATNQAICGVFNDDLVFYDRYLWHYLISFRNNLIEKSFGGAQPNISQGIIQNLNVPLPSLAEQRVIVEKVETLFHFADEVEQRVAATTTHTNHLTQSILARAFRGELVPQDPNDAPASVLLERIKHERGELKAKKKTQKRKSKTLLDFN